jgi:serine phosphatase RsbU (regulator of sigma subunit)
VLLKPRGLPIGVVSDPSYVEGAIVLNPGDALVIYSDGLIDARPDLDLNHYTIANHLNGTDSALAMVDRLVALLAPLGIPPDDVTIVVVLCKEQPVSL